MKKTGALSALLFTAEKIKAQQAVQMADTFEQSGKIYVVIATVAIIFIGLAIYLFTIDRRLKKIEKDK